MKHNVCTVPVWLDSFYDCCLLLQVKIFEEDFRKERSDRERMNEEKEDLRRQVERLQGQITNLTNQVLLNFTWLVQFKVLYVSIQNCTAVIFLFFWFSFIRHRTSVRENEQRGVSWSDCRCSIINRYWLQFRPQSDENTLKLKWSKRWCVRPCKMKKSWFI